MKTRYHAFSPTSSDSVNPTPLLSKAELEIRYNLAFWKFILTSRPQEDVGISSAYMHEDGSWKWKMLTLDRYQDQVEEGVDNAVVTYREVMTSALSQLKAFDRPHYECYDAKLNNNSLPQESETDLRTRGEYLALDFANIGIDLTPTHPATLLLDACGQLEPTSAREPYRFYTQIPSLPKFLLHLAPVLEKRLKESEVWRDKPKTAEQLAREAVERSNARKQAGLLKEEEEEELTVVVHETGDGIDF
ncbi:hypothetical protein BGZ97_006671 [Linnemannia gamsii]|uniref:Uncharacterized protein n=1 Tax=Linnemannia gamsii TaxID=64522 RepID=A0A9P6RB66_9FUNG|nr:hypothetical protein BGZ97_006671 [Linnemannia gamsii]